MTVMGRDYYSLYKGKEALKLSVRSPKYLVLSHSLELSNSLSTILTRVSLCTEDFLPSITASGWRRLSVWSFRQHWVGWKFTGTIPLLAEATSCSSRWHHMAAKSWSYSWSRDTWVAACFSPEHKIRIKNCQKKKKRVPAWSTSLNLRL